jgi:hypothetical protein
LTTIACIAGGIGIALKAIDYGWTAWDAFQDSRTLANPNASRSDKLLAGFGLGLAIALEAAEPDDIFPVGLPLDDVGRRALMSGAREALDRGGEEGFQIYIRHHLGGNADAVFNHIGMPQHSIDAAKIFWGRADKPNQAAIRGWLINDVADVVRNPALTRTHVNHATGNPATYFYRTDGHYAVIDNATGEIIQVSEIGNSNWV